MSTQNKVCCGLITVLAAFSQNACNPNSNSSAPHLAIRTIEDTVGLQTTPVGTSFNVTAIVRNDDSRPLQVALCGTQAQRDIGGTWTTVFTPACISSGLTPLASGDSVIVPVSVFGYTAPDKAAALNPEMERGRYRLLFGVGVGDPTTINAYSVAQVQPSTDFIVR